MVAMSTIDMGSTAIVAADAIVIGAIERLAIAKIESNRGSNRQSFTQAPSHIPERRQRGVPSRSCHPLRQG